MSDPSESYYCGRCGCPVNDHTVEGVCQALDFPPLNLINQCACPCLTTTPEETE